MILNYKHCAAIEREYMGGKVLLDGVEIKQVWFVDTKAGVVRTYDVLGDGQAHLAREGSYSPSDFPGRDVDCPWHGLLSETLRGSVTLIRPAVPPEPPERIGRRRRRALERIERAA